MADSNLPGSVLAIDPGNQESAYVIIDIEDRRPRAFDKIANTELLELLYDQGCPDQVVVEMVASYGMAVGADVFETCVWTGRFVEAVAQNGVEAKLVKRLPIKMHHCHTAKAKDTNVRQAMVDRFADGVPNYGKGTKAQPGWFYGFSSDVWQAYALAVYAADSERTVLG